MKELENVVEEPKEPVAGPSSETSTPTPASPPVAVSEGNGSEFSLEEYANNVVTIMIPVAITMILVVTAVRNISKEFDGSTGSGMTVYTVKSTDSTSTQFLGSLLNAVVIIAAIFAVTVIMVILYYFKLMKILWGWIMGSTAVLLIGFCAYVLYLLLDANNLLFDYISWAIIVYNFGVVGMVAIFWHSPRYINQAYLILISAFTAILFSRLPEWTTWTFLVLMALYDLFAVLVPKGPLRVLLELSQERNETIPALIYNASVYMVELSSPQQPGPLTGTPPQSPTPETPVTQLPEPLTPSLENEPAEIDNAREPIQTIDLTGSPNKPEGEGGLTHLDSQGNLSPKMEAKDDVLVDIPLSPMVERKQEHQMDETQAERDAAQTTTADEDAPNEGEASKEVKDGEEKPRKHRHHHHHHHHHRHHHHRTGEIGADNPTEEGEPSDPSNPDHSHTHRHRAPRDPSRPHRHHHHHHHRHRSDQPLKPNEIAQSPLPVTQPPPPPVPPPAPAQQKEEEKRGVRLGLGDFIFYSVLVGRAAMYDITTVFTCFIAVITGLFVTLLILAFIKRPLPALPVSIGLGMIFYFLTRIFLVPYIKYLSLREFFV